MHYTTAHAIRDIVSVLDKLACPTDPVEEEMKRLDRFVAGQKPATEENVPRRTLTNEEWASLNRSTKGWTREKLATLGIPWPPPKGWRKKLLKGRRDTDSVRPPYTTTILP
jgi:hypothetical protein